MVNAGLIDMLIDIRPRAFDPWRELDDYQSHRLKAGAFGACATFVGAMRDFNQGEQVTHMLLEHYPGMTERQLTQLAKTAITQHGLLDVLLLHRIGKIAPGDSIVLVAAWSAHRTAAFDACREIMETLKTRAAFWKKETLLEGDRWVDGSSEADSAAKANALHMQEKPR